MKAKQQAKASVLEDLGRVTKKDLSKAETILSGIVLDLSNHGLDVNTLLPPR